MEKYSQTKADEAAKEAGYDYAKLIGEHEGNYVFGCHTNIPQHIGLPSVVVFDGKHYNVFDGQLAFDWLDLFGNED